MAILADLMLLLRANSAELTKGLDVAKDGMKKTGDASKGLSKTMDTAFGNIAKSIDKVIPGFSGFTSGIEKAITNVGGFSKSLGIMKTALISTGIGAIVVALGTLISYFKNTAEGADKFNIALNGIKAVISTVMKSINKLGEAVVKLLKGDFKGAAESAKEAFTDFGKTVKESFKSGLDTGKRLEDLEDRRNQLLRTEAEIRKEVADLELIAFDKSKSNAARQDAVNKMVSLEKQLAAEKLSIETEAYNIMLQQNKTREVTDDIVASTNQQYATMLGVQQQQSETLRQTVRLQNRLNEELAKETEERVAQKLEADKLANTKFATQMTVKAVTLPTLPTLAPKIDTTTLAQMTPISLIPNDLPEWKRYWDAIDAMAEESKQKRLEMATTAAQSAITLLDAVSTFQQAAMNNEIAAAGDNEEKKDAIRKKYAKKGKTVSIMQAIINGALGVTKAFADLGPIAGAVAAALVAATTIAQIALIKSQPLAKGGLAYGPTLATIGEYPNAGRNPEVVAPLDKLKRLLGNESNRLYGEIRVDGQDLLLAIENAQKIRGAY